MSNTFNDKTILRPVKPRSKKLREINGAVGKGGSLDGISPLTEEQRDKLNWFGKDAADNIYVKDNERGNARNFYTPGNIAAGGAINGQSSGSQVSWNQIQQSGVRIASITIDGVTKEVWAPEGGGVTSVAGLTGVVSASALQSALGLGALAYKSSLTESDIPSLPTSKITSGVFESGRIPSLSISKITGLQSALDAKQDVISDLASIRSGAALGASAVQPATLNNYIPWSSEGTLSVGYATNAGNADNATQAYDSYNLGGVGKDYFLLCDQIMPTSLAELWENFESKRGWPPRPMVYQLDLNLPESEGGELDWGTTFVAEQNTSGGQYGVGGNIIHITQAGKIKHGYVNGAGTIASPLTVNWYDIYESRNCNSYSFDWYANTLRANNLAVRWSDGVEKGVVQTAGDSSWRAILFGNDMLNETQMRGNSVYLYANGNPTLQVHSDSITAKGPIFTDGNYIAINGANIVTQFYEGGMFCVGSDWQTRQRFTIDASALQLDNATAIYPTNNLATLGTQTNKFSGLYVEYADISGNSRTSRFYESSMECYDKTTREKKDYHMYVSELYLDGTTLFVANGPNPKLGATLGMWSELWCKKWFPNPNDTSHYIEYSNGHWLVHGDFVATGQVAAGQING